MRTNLGLLVWTVTFWCFELWCININSGYIWIHYLAIVVHSGYFILAIHRIFNDLMNLEQ